jgi:gamma-glutamyltranspeptidase/glutathione hydrolase
MTRRTFVLIVALVLSSLSLDAGSAPFRAKRGMVVSQSHLASDVGFQVIRDGGNAVDAAVATAFALAVTHPTAGNIGGGGFLVFRSSSGEATTFDFREAAPAGSHPEMWLVNGKYDSQLHHNSHRAVGVPGTVAGLHLAWKTYGSKPWKELVMPAIALARDGFEVSDALARSLARTLDSFKKYPASLAQFSKNGVPYSAGEILRQPDLARSLQRIADQGPAGFYEGETALLLEKEMKAHGGLITREDLKNYQAKQRTPIRGTYRGYEVIGMPPPSSGGISVQMMLNILEGHDLKANGYGSAKNIHLIAESMRRAFADRARHLGDPDFVSTMPIEQLISKPYAQQLARTINPNKASQSSPTTFSWPTESAETTHFSIVDERRNAVAVTYTLEAGYGSKIVAPGTGFLLNNEMGDFNAGPGLTTEQGLIGTDPNLARPGQRMLSSMTILNVVDFGMNAQEAVDAGRLHHQWLPDRISYEEFGFSADTIAMLRAMGHTLQQTTNQGVAQVIVYNAADDMLEGGLDRRAADGGAAGK